MANKILNLDLSKDPDLPVFIYGRVGDEMMQTATVNITNHDQQKSLEGFVITFEGTINNKIKVFDSDNVKPIDLAKGTFEYTFPSAAFSLAGTYDRAYFSIAKGELRDTTGDFKIVVSSNADITAKEAETIITEYNRLVAKLNQAFKDSVEQMESDYSELESTIEGIKGDISELTIKINNYQENVQETADVAVETINTSVNNAIGEITQAVNKALQKLEAGDFYTKAAADTKFQGYQSTPIMAQDWNTITQPGIYYVNNATGINKPDSLVTTMYGFLEVINNQFSSTATVQRFISFNNEICTRRYSGNPITWGAWEATAKTKDVVMLAKDQEISGVKDFKNGLQVDGAPVNGASYAYLTATGDVVNNTAVVEIPWVLRKTTPDLKLVSNRIVIEKSGIYQFSGQMGMFNRTEDNWLALEVEVTNNGSIVNYIESLRTYQRQTTVSPIATLELQAGAQIRVFKNGASTTGSIIRAAVSLVRIG